MTLARGMAKKTERPPLNLLDTVQPTRWRKCECKPPVYSGRMYLGSPSCRMCGCLIDKHGTRR